MARLCRVPLKTYQEWEDIEYNGSTPCREHVSLISAYTRFPAEFFYGDDIDLIPAEAFSFYCPNRGTQ
jgi:hypothetical protein